MEIRLQKYLADAGVASRRKAEQLIQEGRVKVNDCGERIGCESDTPQKGGTFDNRVVKLAETKKVYILLHKPEGYGDCKRTVWASCGIGFGERCARAYFSCGAFRL